MYELKHLIDVIKYDRLVYIQENKEIFDKIDVLTALNNRIIEIREELLEYPDNKNLSTELIFCENEIERINEDIDEFYKNTDINEFNQENARKLMELNFNELNEYMDLLEKFKEFNVDDKLIESMRDSLKNLEINVNEYINLKLK